MTDNNIRSFGLTKDSVLFTGLLTVSTLLLLELLGRQQLDRTLSLVVVCLAAAFPATAFQLVCLNVLERFPQASFPRVVRWLYILSPLLVWLSITLVFFFLSILAGIVFLLASVLAVGGAMIFRERVSTVDNNLG